MCGNAPPEGEERFPAELFALSLQTKPLWDALASVAGYQLPARSRERFLDFCRHLTRDPKPDELARLDPKSEGRPDWFRRLAAKVLDNVQEGVGACHYHLDNIRTIESALHHCVREHVPRLNLSPTSNFTVAGGDARRVHYEYQAFLLATRRTLEYFAGSVAAYFKANDPGLRGLPGCIAKCDPEGPRQAVLGVLAKNAELIDDLLSQHPRLTVRDRIAHWEPVQAGVLNLTCQLGEQPPFSVGFLGGGEELMALQPIDEEPQLTLSDALGAVLEEIEQLVFDCYAALGLSTVPE